MGNYMSSKYRITDSADENKSFLGHFISKKHQKISLEDKLFLVTQKKDNINHIEINDKECINCKDKPCLLICSAKTYEEINGKIEISYENCLECGSCWIACPKNAISWKNPRGGFGITYQ